MTLLAEEPVLSGATMLLSIEEVAVTPFYWAAVADADDCGWTPSSGASPPKLLLLGLAAAALIDDCSISSSM